MEKSRKHFALALTCVLAFAPSVTRAAAHGNKDLTDLILLTGGTDFTMNLTASALEEMGYEPGVRVNFNMAPPSNDEAMTYKRTKDGHCFAVFQGVNDPDDLTQMVGGFTLPPVDMCNGVVHAGIAQEMGSFLQSPDYSKFVAFLNDPSCTKVTAVGLSMGGALATLWAFCANQGATMDGQAIFGPRTDYDLVTFSPLAISPTPLYNGQPGEPFVGTRYGLTGLDGGDSYLANYYADTKAFRMKLLGIFEMLATANGMADHATQFASAASAFETLSSSEVEAQFAAMAMGEDWYPQFGLAVFSEAQNPESTMGEAVRAMIPEIAASGVLSYAADQVNAMGQFFGFKHALQDFQPLPNMLLNDMKMNPTAMEKVPAAAAVDLPRGDAFQFVFNTLANGGTFVNHATCCYYDGDQCEAKFTPDKPEWRACNNALLAYMPATTCGHVKTMYKANGCCGNPEKTFIMGRRLASLPVQSGENEADLLKDLESALQRATATGGKLEAQKLAERILKVV